MSGEIDYARLARELAARVTPDALLDADDVGALLKCEPRTVREHYARAPGFPKALRLSGPGGSLGHPRWRRQDVVAWVDAHGDKPRSGRQRKLISFS